jgi:hypothetical protein
MRRFNSSAAASSTATTRAPIPAGVPTALFALQQSPYPATLNVGRPAVVIGASVLAGAPAAGGAHGATNLQAATASRASTAAAAPPTAAATPAPASASGEAQTARSHRHCQHPWPVVTNLRRLAALWPRGDGLVRRGRTHRTEAAMAAAGKEQTVVLARRVSSSPRTVLRFSLSRAPLTASTVACT